MWRRCPLIHIDAKSSRSVPAPLVTHRLLSCTGRSSRSIPVSTCRQTQTTMTWWDQHAAEPRSANCTVCTDATTIMPARISSAIAMGRTGAPAPNSIQVAGHGQRRNEWFKALASLEEGLGADRPGLHPPGCDTRRRFFLWVNLQRIAEKRGMTGKKVRGDTLQRGGDARVQSIKSDSD